MKNTYKCSETGCCHKVEFVCLTQFTGDHFYCKTHAELEPDFMKEGSSYFRWMTLEKYQDNEKRNEERQKKEQEEYNKKIEKKKAKLKEGIENIAKNYKVPVADVEGIAEEYNNLRRTL